MPDVFFCEIIENKLLTDAVYSITVVSRELARETAAGQFLHIGCGEARLLRRPISICSVQGDEIRFVFEVKGEGTKWLSNCNRGRILNILGPLGAGYKIPEGKIITVGGGVGTPPLLFAAESAMQKPTAILGFRCADRVILVDEFKAACDEVYITTDDGSVGIHGIVTNPLEDLLKKGGYSTVMSCGQLIMQKSVADLCARYNIPCQVSIEERMGCGVGACLVCVCKTIQDGKVQMSRVCADGPVFDSTQVVW